MDISAITKSLIKCGEDDDFADLPAILPNSKVYHEYMTRLRKTRKTTYDAYIFAPYYKMADEMEQRSLAAFIKALTIAENIYGGGGSVSPVIGYFCNAAKKDGFYVRPYMGDVGMLLEGFRRRPGTITEELAEWVLSHAKNHYLPFGTSVYANNLKDLYTEYKGWARREKETARRKAEEAELVKSRKLQKVERHKQKMADQSVVKASRNSLFEHLKALPLTDMIARITQDAECPVFYYETLLTALSLRDLVSLSPDTRKAFIKYLDPIRHGRLSKLRERLKKEVSEKAS